MKYEKFTIRPKPEKGESLTSYLLRIAKVNQVDIFKLLKELTGKSYTGRYMFQFDLYPKRAINIHILSYLVSKETDVLESLTLIPAISKLTDQSEPFREIRKLSVLFEHRYRKFCPICLKKSNYYKLIWQVKEIEVCDTHLKKLQISCPHCLVEQPYFSDFLVDKLCYRCKSALDQDLDLKNDEKIDTEFIIKQNRLYKDWCYLLDPQEQGPIVNDSLTKERSLAALLLYIAQEKEQLSKDDKNVLLTNTTKSVLRRILLGIEKKQKSPPLFSILNFARQINMPLHEFFRVLVPQSFLNRIVKNKTIECEVHPGPCLAKWCKAFGKSNMMKEVAGSPQGIYKKKYVCLGCYIIYAIDKGSSWVCCDRRLELIPKVKTFFDKGMSPNTIIRFLGKTDMVILNCLGYLRYHGLIKSDIRYKKDFSIRKCFEELYKETPVIFKMYNLARAKFGWKRQEFFYYFNTTEVQDYLLFHANNTRQKKYQSRKEQILSQIKEIQAKELDISSKELAERLGYKNDKFVFRYYGIKHCITISDSKNLEKLLFKNAETYILKLQSEDIPITVIQVIKHLDLHFGKLKQFYPNLLKWISMQVKNDKKRRAKAKAELYARLAQEAVNYLYLNNKKIVYREIADYMGVYPHALYNTPGVVDAINEVKRKIGLI